MKLKGQDWHPGKRGMPPLWITNAKQEEARKQAYRETRSDSQAAKRLGIKTTTFKAWRQARGFPPYQPPKGR